MKSLLYLLPYFRKYKKKYILGWILTTLSSLATAIMPLYVGHAINTLQSGAATSSTLFVDCLFIIGLSAIAGYLFYQVRQTIIVASREIEYDLRNDFLSHVQTLSMRFFQNTPQGEVMAYATNDINAVRNFIGPAVMYSADTLTTFLFSVIFMVSISPLLTLAVIVPLPLMSLGVYLIGKRIHPLFDAVQAHYADLTARATESISGMRVIKAYVREEYEKNLFDVMSDEYYKKNMRLAKVQGLMMPVIFGFVGMSVVILLLVSAPMIIEKKMLLGEMTEFLIYLGMLTWPFIALGWVTNLVQRGAASMARLQVIFDTKPDVDDSKDVDQSITSLKGEIEFQNVSFRYRDELPYVLRHINLRIPRGKTLAIIGRTGSGKTTFVDLIPRLYDTTEGTILVDGHDIRKIPLAVLRRNIGMVPQESFLFSETIHENIAFGLERGTDAEVASAAQSAEIYADISSFPNHVQTLVGERGLTLSGGQKQRTALSRAIARDPNILILDDSMSAVDTATEEKILSNLRSIMKDRTSIIISHRISTVKNADEIIV
ncbi:MAG: ABC transporter ATP-binding protein, partial [Bacteroidota bacterium]|nr:ABC transporter ATP-binding protein [Bacteroidota bacterium]